MAGVWDSVFAVVLPLAPLVFTPFDDALQWVEGRDGTRGISRWPSAFLHTKTPFGQPTRSAARLRTHWHVDPTHQRTLLAAGNPDECEYVRMVSWPLRHFMCNSGEPPHDLISTSSFKVSGSMVYSLGECTFPALSPSIPATAAHVRSPSCVRGCTLAAGSQEAGVAATFV